MNYRKEIDGLRAVAVLPVLFFHAGFRTFSGGFVGVDVFFVISGYLITTIIVTEMREGGFTLVGFYERRARRILPALFAVMLACLPFAWLWMLPSDLKDFSRSLLGVSAFASNILFWRESGYFVTAAELKPLLHTWSLAVEEQFYLLYPISLLLFSRIGKRWCIGILAVVAAISLAGAEWGSIYKPVATFYLLPTRGWELLIGAFSAFFLISKGGVEAELEKEGGAGHQIFSLIGLLLIAYAVFAFDKSTPIPSLYALAPTVGAALIILFANSQTFVGKVLGCKPFVWIGLISYSAYLWHYPMIAFARYRSLAEPSKPVMLVLLLLTFILAFLSWKYLERPFRDRKTIGRAQIFAFGLAGSAVFVLAGCVGYLSEGLPNRFPGDLAPIVFPAKTNESTACKLSYLEGVQKTRLCYFGDTSSSYTIALYGDSHAQALFSVLDESFRKEKIKGVRVYLEGCGVIPGVVIFSARERSRTPHKDLNECLAAYESLLGYLRGNANGVVISIRWSMAIFPVAGSVDELPFDNGEGGVEYIEPRNYMTLDKAGNFTVDADGKKMAIDSLLKSMNSLGKAIFLVHPVPEVGWNVPKVNFVSYLDNGSAPKVISTPYDRFKTRNRFTNDALKASEDYKNIVHVKPESLLCDSFLKGRCVAQVNGVPLYSDQDHLANAGAKLVVDEIMNHIKR